MIPMTQTITHDQNQQKILETIIQKGPLSRADLSKKLGLTKATISSQVQGLLDAGVVEEIGSIATTKGRRPILLQFKGSCGRALAFDITPSGIRAMDADLLGQQHIHSLHSWDAGSDTLMPLLSRIIHEILEHDPAAGSAPHVGISLGIQGAVQEGRILFTPYYRLEGLPLQEQLQQEFGLPIYLNNEANLSALGERTFSFGSSSLVNINIHEGIGLGIIMNNQLYTGADGFAGEFGHTIVEPEGRPCPCGNRGCIEQYASLDAVLRKYNQLNHTKNASINDLAAGYQKEEASARLVVEDFIKYMAIGINNIASIFNPQLIVINSLLTACLPDMVPRIRKQLQNAMSRDCAIVPSPLQDTAALLGGIALCARKFLGIEDFRPAGLQETIKTGGFT